MDHSIFVGRKNELKQLNGLLEEVKKGYGKFVFVEGEPGAGKTSLIRQFLRPHEPDNLIALVKCGYNEDIYPYTPIKKALAALNADAGSNSEEEKNKIFTTLKNVLGEAGSDWIALIPIIGGFTSAAVSTLISAKKQSGKSLKAADVRGTGEVQKLFEVELRRLAKKKPVIIFLDDLQWADRPTLNMLFALGRSIRENSFPLLLIGSYRPYEIKGGRTIFENGSMAHPFSSILNELRRYSREDTFTTRQDEWLIEMVVPIFEQRDIRNLINTAFPGNNFPPDFVKQLDNRTQGNPLFVVSILDSSEQCGDIFLDENGVFQLNKGLPDKHKLPKTIEAVIQRRLDFLDNDLRKILDYASVSGEDFSLEVIKKLLKIDELVLMNHIDSLTEKYGLISPSRNEHFKKTTLEFYCFRHRLVHNYVYKSLGNARRKALHRETAKILKDLYGNELEKLEEVKVLYDRHIQIGCGFIDGVTSRLTKEKIRIEDNKKVKNLIEAARAELENAKNSFEQYAMEECIEKVEKTLALLRKLQKMTVEAEEIKFNALMWKNKAASWLGFYDEAHQIALQLLRIAEKQRNQRNISTALIQAGMANHNLGNYSQAIRYFHRALKIAERLNDEENKAILYNDIGWAIYNKSNFDNAIENFQKALEINKILDNNEGIASNYNGIGNALYSKGVYDKAIEYFKKSMDIRKHLNDEPGVAIIYNNIGYALYSKGDWKDAIEYFKKSLAVAESLNDKVRMTAIYNNIGNFLNSKEDYTRAVEYYKKSLEISEIMNFQEDMEKSYNGIGEALYSEGDHSGAIEYFKKSLEISETLNHKGKMAHTYSNIGNAWKSKKDYNKALNYYEKALSINNRMDDDKEAANTLEKIADIFNLQGEYDKALEHLREGLKIRESLGDRKLKASSYNHIGLTLFYKEKYDEAIGYYEDALTIYEDLEDEPLVKLTRLNLAYCSEKIAERNLKDALNHLKKAHENWLILEKQEKMERLNKKITKLELEFEI